MWDQRGMIIRVCEGTQSCGKITHTQQFSNQEIFGKVKDFQVVDVPSSKSPIFVALTNDSIFGFRCSDKLFQNCSSQKILTNFTRNFISFDFSVSFQFSNLSSPFLSNSTFYDLFWNLIIKSVSFNQSDGQCTEQVTLYVCKKKKN